jgi:hypothetical protein
LLTSYSLWSRTARKHHIISIHPSAPFHHLTPPLSDPSASHFSTNICKALFMSLSPPHRICMMRSASPNPAKARSAKFLLQAAPYPFSPAISTSSQPTPTAHISLGPSHSLVLIDQVGSSPTSTTASSTTARTSATAATSAARTTCATTATTSTAPFPTAGTRTHSRIRIPIPSRLSARRKARRGHVLATLVLPTNIMSDITR